MVCQPRRSGFRGFTPALELTGRTEAEREIPRTFEAGFVQNRRMNIAGSQPFQHIGEPLAFTGRSSM